MIVNPYLVWDYGLKDADFERGDVREWYIARVLTKGNWNDIQNAGLDNIRKYLPKIKIPPDTREFWEWYFNYGEKYVSDNKTTENAYCDSD